MAAKPSSSTDDLYLEDMESGVYPPDDDDFSSGSGSGKNYVTFNSCFPITTFSSWLSGLLCCSGIDLVLFSGAGEEEEVMVTVNTLFIAPKAKPTQDTTKDFTPRVETFTVKDWDHTRELPKQPVRTEVGLKLFKRIVLCFKYWLRG